MTAEVELPEALLERLVGVRSLVVLTGAGMSNESGVPVFRGPGGLWEGFRPEDLATPEAFARDPGTVWRWYRWRLERILASDPHPGHAALARLERSGRLESFTLVTQNVDGLHQRAGSGPAFELHGNITRARCSAGCGAVRPAVTVDPDRPRCGCGAGRFRPDVVWFGEPLDLDVLTEAARRVERADMVWVVGTSGIVYPAAALPEIAQGRGVPVVEVNPDATAFSGRASFVVRVPASIGLPRLVGALTGPDTDFF